MVHRHFRIVLNPENDLHRGLWDPASVYLLRCVSAAVTLHPAFDASNYKCAYPFTPLGLCMCYYLPLETLLHLVLLEAHSSYSSFKVKVGEVAQSCPTLCDPMDCSQPGSSVHGIFQTRVLEWGAIKLFSRVQLLATPWTVANQAPPSMRFSRQEYWSGVPLPSPTTLTPGSFSEAPF